jgi:hypothetical protein
MRCRSKIIVTKLPPAWKPSLPRRAFRRALTLVFLAALPVFLSSCVTRDTDHKILVSVADQRLVLFEKKVPVASWLVSTSKFGTGDRPGSYATPLGRLEIAAKIGDSAPSGAVFHSRRWTGEIVRPNAPGRDPIVSRILWLKGLDPGNRRAYSRTIYIHGTPEESKIGEPASFGCIRMRSNDVIALYNWVGKGTEVEITNAHLPPNLPVYGNQPDGTAGE